MNEVNDFVKYLYKNYRLILLKKRSSILTKTNLKAVTKKYLKEL